MERKFRSGWGPCCLQLDDGSANAVGLSRSAHDGHRVGFKHKLKITNTQSTWMGLISSGITAKSWISFMSACESDWPNRHSIFHQRYDFQIVRLLSVGKCSEVKSATNFTN